MELTKNTKTHGKCRCFGWHLVSVIFIAFGFSLVIFFPEFFNNQLLKNLELHPASRTYSEWKAPTVPLYMDIYLFNWTNPDEIRNKSSKPSFTQLGPYRFREFLDKLNISFDSANLTVSYRKISTYYFDPDGSNGSLSDLCTTVNMVAIGTGVREQNSNYFTQRGVSFALSTYGEKLEVTKTVQELLFDGYKDPLVSTASFFGADTPFDLIGYLVKKNATDELSGTYTVNTGVDNIHKLGSISKYNNRTEFPFYEGECQKLKGSAGEFFSPEPSLSEPIRLFTPDMCRSIPYDYEKDIELHNVKGNRFAAGARALDNGTLYNETKCYASDESVPSGVMNISICSYGQPMFMSFPHFFGGDESYLNSIEGLKPDLDKHQAYITLEPTTGITLEVAARFQTNVLLKQYGNHISVFDNVPRVFMPLLWVEQKFVMDAEKAGQIRFALLAPWIGQIVGISLLIVGCAILSIRHFRRLFSATTHPANIHSKHEDAVIKDYEMNPLVSHQQIVIGPCCKL